MKKKIGFLALLLSLAFVVPLYAGGNIFTIEMAPLDEGFSGTTVTASGTSVFAVLDLNNVMGHGSVSGACTFQIKNIDLYKGGSSGTTTNWYYRQTSDNTAAGWAGAQKVTIVSGLACSGNTKYAWSLDLDLLRYFRIECTAGVTDIDPDIILTFQNPGGK